jgi:long-chain acyl-CoA synthetase
LLEVPARSVIHLLQNAARLHGDAAALHQPSGRGYRTLSWNHYLQAVNEIAAGLRSLGVNKGEVVALNSETRLEFYLADLGAMANGSIAAALYPSYPAKDLLHNLEAGGACAVFLEEPKMLAALREAKVRHWILLTGTAEGAITLDELRAKGRAALAGDPQLAARIEEGPAPDDPAILYLTSGVTGEPKMAMVTHRALVANLEMAPEVLPLSPKDSTVAFLPSAHIAQRVVIELLPIHAGMPVTFSESLLKLPGEIRKVRPTILLAPPRMWERIYSTICTELRKRPAPARQAFYGGLALGLAAARYRREGKPVPLRIRIPLKLADRLLFHKLRARFGGRIRVAASGAAPLSKELAEFYEAVGMPLIEGYGLTEGGVATLNPLDRPKPGSIGKPLHAAIEVRFAEDGELLLKSPCLFSGYHNDLETTAQVLRDGWLHTGDIAYADDEGYIFITGRKKELIVSSTGKKIYPSRVEALFRMEPLISQVLLIGDRLPFLTALFTINPAAAATLKGMEPWKGRPAQEVAASAPVAAEIQKAVVRVNQQLAPFEQVRKYRVLPRDFSIEAGELTATMKLRRSRALENCREEIAELYAGRD